MTVPSWPARRESPFWAASEENTPLKVASRSLMASPVNTTGQTWVWGTWPTSFSLAAFTALETTAWVSRVSSLPTLNW